MTTQELMIPRVEVMFSHPHSPIKKGEILTMQGDLYLDEQAGYSFSIAEINEYTELFRRLKWYELREIVDLPMYLKNMSGYIVPVFEWHNMKEGTRFIAEKYRYILKATFHNPVWYTPSTLEEYADYLTSKI